MPERKRLMNLIWISGALLVFAETACGEWPGTTSSPFVPYRSEEQTQVSSIEQFRPGTWTFLMDGAFITARTNPRFEQFVGGHVGVEFFLPHRWSLQADVPVYWVNQSSPKAIGEGFDLLARWRFFERGRLSVYLDGGAGLLDTNHEVPRTGTHFNFTPQMGIGATWFLDQQTFIYGGARLWHLSNAGIFGHDRNPSVNESIMGYLGIGWRL